MATRELTGYQREVAERNAEAILDAAEDLLRSQGHVNISAVAVQAGVSRVTVYAHFPTWQALLEAAVERAVRRTMAAAVAESHSPEAVMRTHQAAHQTIGTLLERGRADGSFRTDLPIGWLVTACIALIHACSDQVRGGQIDPDDAVRILTTSVRDLFTGTRAGRPRHHAGH